MFGLSIENTATLLIDGSAIFLLAGVFTETSIMRRRGRLDDKLFYLLIVLDAIVAVSDIVTYLSDKKDFAAARFLNMAGVSVFYIALLLMCMVWLHYCLVRFSGMDTSMLSKSLGYKFIFAIGLFTEALIIINGITGAGFFFSVDENNVYHYGKLFVIMFIVMGLYVFAGFFIISRYRTNFKRKLIPIWIYILPLLAGLAVPFVFGGVSLTSICCGMGITFTHLGSASEISDPDEKAGVGA